MRTIVAVLVCAGAYATLRYNVFKGVAWSDWPNYVLNKVFALSSLALLTVYVARRAAKRGHSPAVLKGATLLMLAHVWLSLILLRPAYFPGYFADGRFPWPIAASLTLGVLAAVAIGNAARKIEADAARPAAALGFCAFLVGIHAGIPGLKGWITPHAWPGNMPPITLISFALGAVALALALVSARRRD